MSHGGTSGIGQGGPVRQPAQAAAAAATGRDEFGGQPTTDIDLDAQAAFEASLHEGGAAPVDRDARELPVRKEANVTDPEAA